MNEPRVVLAPITVVVDPQPDNEFRARTSLTVIEDEPVFAGHYPGRPIFPGVCLLDTALRSARMTGPSVAARPVEIEAARFTGMVVPGDVVTVDLSWQQRDSDWRCSARVSTGAGEVARIRLRYAGSMR